MLLRVGGSIIIDFAVRIILARFSGSVSAVVFIGRLHWAVQQVLTDGSQLRGLLLFLLLTLTLLRLGLALLANALVVVAIAVLWLEEVVLGGLAHESAASLLAARSAGSVRRAVGYHVVSVSATSDWPKAIVTVFTIGFVDLMEFVRRFSISELAHEFAGVLLSLTHIVSESSINHVVDVIFGDEHALLVTTHSSSAAFSGAAVIARAH